MKRVIVAGAGGFLGKNLIKNLVARGYSVTALDVKLDEELRSLVEFISVESKTLELVKEQLKQVYECFYDLAWVGTSGPKRADYNIQLDNVRLTCDYVKLAVEIGCKRFIYASSINEMQAYEYLQSDNIEPSWGYIYSTGKLAAHFMAETIAFQQGIEFIPVIITNIYGVGEKSARLVYTMITKLLKGEHCSFTEGYQTYDFIYITDAINSIIEVAEKGRAFNRYYIGSGEPKSLREFLIKIRDIVSPETVLGFGEIPFNGISVNYNQFDMKQIEKDTGYKNQIAFEEGIRMTADYIRSEGL